MHGTAIADGGSWCSKVVTMQNHRSGGAAVPAPVDGQNGRAARSPLVAASRLREELMPSELISTEIAVIVCLWPCGLGRLAHVVAH